MHIPTKIYFCVTVTCGNPEKLPIIKSYEWNLDRRASIKYHAICRTMWMLNYINLELFKK